jgi:uncharacterized protein involved in outer membrane biogenesis
MKRTAIVAGGILLGLIVLALVVPALIDWNAYKGDIQARAEAALGRKVEIAGPLRIRLLPSLAVTAEKIAIANLPGAEPAQMITADAVRLKLQLLPLLAGRVVVDPLVVEKPVVVLEKLQGGRANWDFTPARPEGGAVEPAGPAKPTAAGPKAGGRDVRLEGVAIQDGTLTYRGEGGQPVEVKAIDAHIDVGSLSGPFSAQGSFRLPGGEVAFDGAVDAFLPDRGTPFRAALRLPGADAKLTFDGMVSELSGGQTARGHLSLAAPSLQRAAAALGGPETLPAAPLSAEGTLSVSRDEAALQDLAVLLGDSRAEVSLVAALATSPMQVDASLKAATLDLDKLQAMASAAQAPAAPSKPGRPAKSPERGAEPGGPPAKAGFALPRGVAANLAAAVDTVVWRGGVVRQVVFDGVLDDGTLSVSRASAQLPGNAAVKIDGTLSSPQAGTAFDGSLHAQADNLRALLDWLKIDAAGVPEGRLRRFALTSKLALRPGEASLTDLDLSLDATHARGGITARLDGRPAFGVTLAADAVDADSYLPPPARATRKVEAQAPASQGAASGPTSGTAPAAPPFTARLADFDATVRLKLGQLVLHQVSAAALTLDATLAGGDLTIRDAIIGDLAGASAKVGGSVVNLASATPGVQQLAFDLRSNQPARLFRFFGLSSPVPPERLGALALTGTLDGDWNAIALKSRLAAGAVEASVDGTLSSPLQAPRYAMAVAARAPSFAQVARLFAEGYRPKGGGPFTLSAKLAGDPAKVDLNDLDARAGEAAITGHAHVDLGDKPVVTAELAGNAIDLNPFLPAERSGWLLPLPGGLHGPGGAVPGPAPAILPAAVGEASHWSRNPMDLSALRAFDGRLTFTAKSLTLQSWRLDAASAQLAVANGAATLDKLAGRLLGGELSGTARLTGGFTPTLTGQFAIANANLKDARLGAGGIAVAQGRLTGDARLQSAGRSSYELVSALNGDARLDVRDGLISGFDLPAVNQRLSHIENIGSLLGLVQSGMSGGSTRFSALTGSFHADNGVITSRDLKLDAEGGGATGEATVNLPRYTIDSRIAFRLAEQSAPPLALRLEGPLDAPRKIIDVNALQRYLAERGLGKALGKNGGGLFEALTGRKPKEQAEAPAAEPAPQPEKPPKPADVLRQLFKGLGK